MALHPLTLERSGDRAIDIAWSDGQRRRYGSGELRDGCPCATCREKRTQPQSSPLELTILSPQEAQPLTIVAMRPVGNYAYAIEFSDGHDSGIYTFEHLRELGQVV